MYCRIVLNVAELPGLPTVYSAIGTEPTEPKCEISDARHDEEKKKKNTFPAETLALHEEDFNNAAIRKQRALFRPDHLG